MALKRTVARAATSIVVFLLFAELLGLVAYYIDTGALFYIHRKAYQELLPTPQDHLFLGEAVHPYFGFTHKPGVPFDIPEPLRRGTAIPARLLTNNFGFASPHQYPVRKTGDNQFIVGIFGGSVGLWFCHIGAPRLVETLAANVSFAGKEIVPLCFAHEGYKQPQEAAVLGYFVSIGQPFDLVVNIDGFNDVALGSINNDRGLDFSMPSVQHLDPLINIVNQSALTPDKLETLAGIFRDRRQLIELTERIRTNRFASVNFVLDRYHQVLLDRYVRGLGRYSNLPSNPAENVFVQVAPSLDTRDQAKLHADIAAMWRDSSVLMRNMLAERGASYFHFLQPNQYHSTRQFRADEAAIALNEASPYRTSVSPGYKALIAAGAELQARDVHFFDASGVFDHEPAHMYMDDCCHYTQAGNYVLADFVAASILKSPGPWR
jgi:hypothetical protein